MKVQDAMTTPVITIDIGTSIRLAAARMLELNIGALIVTANDQIVGIVTDRDIAVRAVAAEHSVNSSVGAIMSEDIRYCFEDEDIKHVMKNMGEIGKRRLPVVNRDKRLVGILSLANIVHVTGGRLPKDFCDGVAVPVSRSDHRYD